MKIKVPINILKTLPRGMKKDLDLTENISRKVLDDYNHKPKNYRMI